MEGFLFCFFFLSSSYNLLCHTSDTAKVKEEWVCECDKFDGFVVVCFVEGTKRAGIGGMRERERPTFGIADCKQWPMSVTLHGLCCCCKLWKG